MKVVVSYRIGKDVFESTVNAKNGKDAIKEVKAEVNSKKAYDFKVAA